MRRTVKIHDIINESDTVRTFVFHYSLEAAPGQFIMLTDFAGGEKPFSLSDSDTTTFSVTIKKIGSFTSRLFRKKIGDFLSFRGPFGTCFTEKRGKVLLVGGGYGTPPLYFLAKRLISTGAQIIVVNGARAESDLLFCNRFEKLNLEYQNITQSGCLGKEGTSVDLAQEVLNDHEIDFVYAAGPELMMSELKKLLESKPYEFLLERYMKCAIGICGNCTVDPIGIRLCVEGPVLSNKIIEQLTEFGKYHRDASGKKVVF